MSQSTKQRGRPRRLPPGCKWLDLDDGTRVVDMYLSLGVDPATGKRIRKHTRAETADAAWRTFEKARAAQRAGQTSKTGPAARVTIEEHLNSWLDSRRNPRPSTIAGYRGALKPLIETYGDVQLRKLTAPIVDKLITDLENGYRLEHGRKIPLRRQGGQQRRPWKPRTVQLFVTVLGMALDAAQRDGLIDRNIADDIELRPVKRYRAQTWTPAQSITAIKAMRGHKYEAAFLLAMHGYRRGEICGLDYGPAGADLDAGRITINPDGGTRVLVDGKVLVSDPKSERSARTLPMTPMLIEGLKRAKAQQAADKLRFGTAYTDSAAVVRTEFGARLNPDSLTGAWSRFCTGAGLPVIRLHDARHTIATVLHHAGCPTALISAWVGHASTAFTLNTYVQDQAGANDVTARLIQDILAGTGTD